MLRRATLLIVLIGLISDGVAQINTDQMMAWQDSLSSLSKQLYEGDSDPVRLEKNASLVKTLVSALKERHSFDYPFSGLDMLSIVQPPDSTFRVISWNVPLSDGSYLYYGAIQNRTEDGSLKLVPLLDQTFEIKYPHEDILSTSRWYGAQYYQIVPYSQGYLLLGWKGHTDELTQKVIEPLSYDGNRYVLGGRVFPEDDALARKIFSYTRSASMYLRYHDDERRIVFDHLTAPDPEMSHDYRYFGPDLSFDAYRIQGATISFESNIEFRSPPDDDELGERNPLIPLPGNKSGF